MSQEAALRCGQRAQPTHCRAVTFQHLRSVRKTVRQGFMRVVYEALHTSQPGRTGRRHIDEAFRKACNAYGVGLSAIDADMTKTELDLWIGVDIIASVAYDQSRKASLVALDARQRFAINTTHGDQAWRPPARLRGPLDRHSGRATDAHGGRARARQSPGRGARAAAAAGAPLPGIQRRDRRATRRAITRGL